jgi:preprotein translocase subunit SecB
VRKDTPQGTPQGGVCSPILANLYLHHVIDKLLMILKSSLQIHDYIIESINYNHNPGFSKDKVKIDLDINREVVYEDDESDSTKKQATVRLKMNLFENHKENNYPFSLDIILAGKFLIENPKSDIEVKTLMGKNAVAILFTYLRSLVSIITAIVSPLILPPLNIAKLVEKRDVQDEE